ncbi:MAG: DEAD/DEAH box helicase [Myxococcales bacterium]|nr:DEAD/DEAH box helicase [Myxococcales bacterium]
MTPIQARAIPPLLAGRDVLGSAQTGTGKTAAFLLPIIDHLARNPSRGKPVIRTLVLTPTRELAAQIGESFDTYARFLKLRHRVIFGGVNERPQIGALRRGIDALIATPGRLLDLHSQGHIDFSHVNFFVLDEADRMLDMGFIRDIRKVLALLPQQRQNLLFSATMPHAIVKLASTFLHDPIRVEVEPESTTVELITQQVMFVERSNKKRLLKELLLDPSIESAIVFTRTKHGADRVVRILTKADIHSAAIHGNKSQGARQRALAAFKAGDVRVLVATDIASRGIDVDGISHVFNYDLPNISESYVHRIGRTGRAGRDGIAIAFCDENETEYLRDIEKLTGTPLTVVTDHAWHYPEAMPDADSQQETRKGRRSGHRPWKPARPPKGESRRERQPKEDSRNQRRSQNDSGGQQQPKRENDDRKRSKEESGDQKRTKGAGRNRRRSRNQGGAQRRSKGAPQQRRRRRKQSRPPKKR